MGRRKIEDREVRKLGKTAGGTCVYVTLPIEIIRELKWPALSNNFKSI